MQGELLNWSPFEQTRILKSMTCLRQPRELIGMLKEIKPSNPRMYNSERADYRTRLMDAATKVVMRFPVLEEESREG